MGESGGGPPRSVSQLCNALCHKGSAIGIVTAVDPGDPIVPLDAGIQLIPLPGRGNSFMDRLRSADFGAALDAVHQTNPISVIHQHGIWLRSSHGVTTYAHVNRLPLIIAPRGMLEPWAINNSKWKKKLAWALYQKRDLQRATAFHATAQSEAESIRRLGFKQPIAVIPNGVVLPDLAGSREQRGKSMEHGAGSVEHGVGGDELGAGSGEPLDKLGTLQGTRQAPSSTPHAPRSTPRAPSSMQEKRTALFLSRINPKKGLPMLLDAWQRVAPEGWRLVIAGNDDANHLPVVERKIRELGLQDQVEVAGPLFGAAKEAAYRNADLFVLPSYSENFGIVVAEALGYGVPVLTTTGCPWQELQTYGCGWWVEPTPEGIEAGLKSALGVGGMEQGAWSMELRAMGLRGRALVEEKYQWPGIAERMLEFYDWILNGGKQPDFVV